jgi:hypothetical protein
MKRLVLLLLIEGIFCLKVQAENLYVPSVSYPTIQSAINHAITADKVIVSAGRHKENINFLGKAITVSSTDPNNPNTVASTIIDGNSPADINFASAVTFNHGEDNRSTLTGFTITGGTGSWLLISWQYKGVNWSRCGGGVVCYNMSAPTISKNVFTNNIAGQGGGIFAYGNPVNPNNPSNPTVHIKPVIKENMFSGNRVLQFHGFVPPNSIYPNFDRGDGGAIACFQGCDALIEDNDIFTNYAYNYGGGIRLRQWSNSLIKNNEIINNNAILGGAIHVSYTCSPVITENIISSNTSRGLGAGGISLYYNSFGTITNNIILQNKTLNNHAGGIGVFWDSSAIIENNIIAKNSAISGGGIYANGGQVLLKYNTIANNSADSGSGICLEYNPSVTAFGNILVSNTGSAQVYGGNEVTLNAACNDIWSESEGRFSGALSDFTGINGNISQDPKLASPDTNDFSLTVYSPCINAGDPNFTAQPNQKDINGDDRIMGQYVDIGADEAWPIWNITKGTKYLTIQQAINDSSDKDTIIAGLGCYFETINFGTKKIVLCSTEPNDWDIAEKTIIDANQSDSAVVIAGNQDANTILKGFTITGGNAQNGHGGGIWCYASPKIEHNIIRDNYAYYKGGGLYFSSNQCHPSVTDNRIMNNWSDYGGAMFCDTDSSATLENNHITDNYSTFAGGAICCGAYAGQTQIINNEITGNSSWTGGGLASENLGNLIKIYGNLFCGNYASGRGGAILTMYGDPNIINNTIANNRSLIGAGISIETGSSPQIINNTIAFNQFGRGIYCSGTHPYAIPVISNDVYGNQMGNYGGILPNQTGINGNISVDPNFVNIGYWLDPNTPADFDDDVFIGGNFHLLPVSACIDAADSNYVPSQLVTDIDGEERIFGQTVDIGSDEVVTNPFDFNTDGIVDFYELEILIGEWLQTGSSLQCDFHKDGFIDFLDLAELAKHWFWTGGWYQK